MTATPIPRTMHLSLMGGRDMSVIMTPPRDRRPIQTEIVEFRDDVIAHALMKEADRGGQSFFVHNRVETIDAMAAYIGRLVCNIADTLGGAASLNINLYSGFGFVGFGQCNHISLLGDTATCPVQCDRLI